MKHTVDQAVLRISDKCDKEFMCQADCNGRLCKIKPIELEYFTLLLCLEKAPCSYKIEIEQAKICNCPTRAVIFEKYND